MRLFSRDYSQVTVTAFYALSLAEYHMNTHTHDSCEIMYVTGGACRILLPDGERTLKEKEFIFLNAQIPHCLVISPSSPCSLLNLEFHCDSAEAAIDIWDAAQESPVLLSFLRGFQDYSVGYDNGSLGYAVKDLIRHLEKNMTFSPDSAHQTFLTRLLFFRFLLELSDCLIHPRKETGMIYLRKACAYISSHLTEEIRIPQLAVHAGVNKSYLQALFAKYMNSTITDYINQKRLEQAEFLLTNSSLTITDIAFHCGYNSRQHFAKTFHKFHQLSPRLTASSAENP